jgi:hypothetical protein
MCSGPKSFEIYQPGEANPEQVTLPTTMLKTYLKAQGHGLQVALIHLPNASGPFFGSIEAIPKCLLYKYSHIASIYVY